MCAVAIFMIPVTAFAITCEEYFPSTKNIDVKVYSSVEQHPDGFKYSYALTSSQISVQEVSDFMVEFYSPISNTKTPKGWFGMATGIPPGSPYSWASEEVKDNIKQGESINGFAMQSEGLPAIVTYYAHGWQEPVVHEEELTQEEEDACADAMNIFIDAFKGKTIGPTAPPADFKPIEFLDNIISMKHEAYSLGWIKSRGIEQSLDAKLDAAKKKLTQGNTKAAKDILNAFVNEVEAQGCETYENCPEGKHLTSEAYALLKYNALYLIERL